MRTAGCPATSRSRPCCGGASATGTGLVGDKIATLEELEREFNVARVTVRQAIDLLQGEGLVKSFQGRGTFVTKAVENDRWMQLATDWESLIAPIRDHVPQRAALRTTPGSENRGRRRHAGAGLRLFAQRPEARRQALRLRPRARCQARACARAPKQFSSRVALAVLSEMKDLAIARAHQTVVVGAADIETARHLGIALNAPTAEARCVVTDKNGVIIYIGEITYPGDYVRLNIELIAQGAA